MAKRRVEPQVELRTSWDGWASWTGWAGWLFLLWITCCSAVPLTNDSQTFSQGLPGSSLGLPSPQTSQASQSFPSSKSLPSSQSLRTTSTAALRTRAVEGQKILSRAKRGWVWNQMFVLEEFTGPDPILVGRVSFSNCQLDIKLRAYRVETLILLVGMPRNTLHVL